ncbi:hypothetical protein V2J09_012325 [Rumex salicifolius]
MILTSKITQEILAKLIQINHLSSLIIIINDLGSQTLQSFSWDFSNSDKRVELFLGILIFVSLAGHADSDPSWDTSDSSAPDLLVQLHINPYVGCSHSLLCKLPDLLYCIWGLLLEVPAMEAPVEVNCVLPGDNLLLPSLGAVHHFRSPLKSDLRLTLQPQNANN